MNPLQSLVSLPFDPNGSGRIVSCVRLLGARVLVGCSLFVFAGCDAPEEERTDAIRPVRVMPVSPSEGIRGGDLPGRAEATNEVNLAFEVSGLITEIAVSKGDRVEAGDTLARLAPRDYQNYLNSAVAERERAQAQFDRVLEASRTGAVSEQEVTNARATLSIAQANLDIAQKALEDTVLIAPFDGVVATVFADEFQRVQRAQDILRLLDDSEIEFTVQLPERFVPYLPFVEKFSVTFDVFGDRPLEARVSSLGSEASEATRTYPLTLAIDQPEDFRILPGMSGRADVELDFDRKRGKPVSKLPIPGVRIPSTALFDYEGDSAVWIYDEATSTVSRRTVEVVGVSGEGIFLQINELTDVRWIVTAGVQFLNEGQSVRLLKQE